jgi:hypothetical protein
VFLNLSKRYFLSGEVSNSKELGLNLDIFTQLRGEKLFFIEEEVMKIK